MLRARRVAPIPVLAAAIAWGAACATWDNPAALSDLQPTIEQTLSTADIETYTAVDIEVAVESAGGDVMMGDATLQLIHATAGTRTLALTFDNGHYHVDAVFVAAGEYHAHLEGTPAGHALHSELGEFEFTVHHLHVTAGPWTVEVAFEALPAAVPAEAHLVLTIEDATGTPGPGLVIDAELHQPDGTEGPATFTDLGDGRYEAEVTLGAWGRYELHATIDGVMVEIPLLLPDPEAETVDHGDTGGGHGH